MPASLFPGGPQHVVAWGVGVTIAATVNWSLAVVATRILRRGSAATRHQIWAIASLAVVVSPLALPVLQRLLPIPESPDSPFLAAASIVEEPALATPPDSTPAPNDVLIAVPTSPESRSSSPLSEAADSRPMRSGVNRATGSLRMAIPWSELVIVIWLAGVLVQLAAFVRTSLDLRKLLARAVPLTGDGGRFESLLRRHGLSRQIGLRQSSEITVPFVAGLFRPCVVLPATCGTWSEAALVAVLTHELMHVRRRDILWQTFARLGVAWLWFHPLSWFALRSLRAEAEKATDDAVLGTGPSPCEYAQLLLSIARQALPYSRRPELAIFMARHSGVEERFRSILDPTTNRQLPRRSMTSAVGLATLAATVVIALVAPGRAQERHPPSAGNAEAAIGGEPGLIPGLADGETTGDAVPSEWIHEILDAPASIEIRRETTLHEALAHIAWTYRIPIRLDEFSFRPAGSSGHDRGRGLPETRGTLRSVLKQVVESFLPEPRPSNAVLLQRVQDGMVGISLGQDAGEYLLWQPGASPLRIVQIRGTVRHEDGSPVPRARLEARGWSVSTFAVADKNGEFLLPAYDAFASGMIVIATDSDSRAGVAQLPAVDPRKTPPLVSIVIEPTVDGELTSVDSMGKPVAGADVALNLLGGQYLRRTTDAAGRLTLSLPPALPVDSIVVWKGGAGLDYHQYQTLPGDSTIQRRTFGSVAKDLRFTLSGAKSATLVLTDDHDRPLPGIRIYPFVLRKKEETDSLNLTMVNQFGEVTNSAGEATFDWLPDWSFGGLSFHHTSTGHGQQQMVITSADPAGVRKTFRLIPRARISGHVRTPAGEPVTGAEILGSTAGYDDSGRIRPTKTDQGGGYSVMVDPDQLCLLLAQSADGQLVSAARDDIVTSAGADLTGVDFVLEPATVIRGTITSPSGVDGGELGGVMLSQYGREIRNIIGAELPNPKGSQRSVAPQWARQAVIGPDGQFEFRVAPGRYHIRGPQQATQVGGDGWITVAGQAEVEVKLSIPPVPGTLAGRVVTGDPDRGIPQARVKAIDETLDFGLPNLLTDDAGTFQLKKSRSRMFLQAYSPDRKLGRTLEVDPEAESVTLELVPTARVRFRLVDPNGQPLMPKALVIARFAVFGNVTWNPDPPVPLGKDGTVEFPDLIVGARYVFEISHDDGQTFQSLIRPAPIESGPVDLGDVTVNPRKD